MITPSIPTIALLTDFTNADWFVGVMKGVIAGLCPAANIIDICHEVERQNITHAAFILSVSRQWFPDGTIFVAVVDPGVGTQREGVIARSGSQYFVGPNNGLFGFLQEADTGVIAENSAPASATFHGRDIFAPAAGRLAAGQPFASLVSRRTTLVPTPFPLISEDPREGEILYFDTFGNAISNLCIDRSGDLAQVILPDGLKVPVVQTYADVPQGHALAYRGSAGYLEIAVNRGNAQKELQLQLRNRLKLA